eukprot:COSAG01_NODE_1409_length_10417_cov_4.920043_13_plen_198_part_00
MAQELQKQRTADMMINITKHVANARHRLIYGAAGKLIPESLEDESEMMEDGADVDGGDGLHPQEEELEPGHEDAAPSAESAEELLLAQMQQKKMLSPSGTFRSRWDLVQAVLLIYIAINVPYRIGFDQGTQPFEFWFVFDMFVDVYFWIDLVLNFRTAVYTADGEIEISPKRVRQIYMRNWFVIDFVSCLPFAYVGE